MQKYFLLLRTKKMNDKYFRFKMQRVIFAIFNYDFYKMEEM